MKLAAMNYHYIRYPLNYFLDHVEQSPLRYIEFYAAAPHLNIYTYTLNNLVQVKKAIKERNLEIVCLTPENCVYPVNLSSQDRILREDSLKYYMRVLDTAEYLQSPKVQLCLGYGFFDQPREEAWANGRDSLFQLTHYAEQKGIQLILEPLMVTTSNVINSSAQLIQMIQEINAPNLAGMLDLSQMAWYQETPADYFRNLGDKLQHIHFNDRAHLVPGDGDLPMKDYFDQIISHGYNDTMAFEICDRRYFCDPNNAIDRIVEWFNKNTDIVLG